MIKSPKEADNFPLKQEGHHSHNNSNDHHEKANASSSISSAQWPRLKDPRIVRVSRAFGGKDRHSKVCTIRGLRDRRVRLSVPTAIQLYDLQERLGLSQPSKVVDWLLNAAKHEIDELPPLPNIPSLNNFTLGYPSHVTSNQATTSHHSQPNQQLLSRNNIQWEGSSQNSMWKLKPNKEVSRDMVGTDDKANWMNRSIEEDKQGRNDEGPSTHANAITNSILPRPNHSSFLGLLNTMPHGYQWEEPSSGDVSHQLGNNGFSNQTEIPSINVVPFPTSSTLSLSTGNSSQILLCPRGAATQPYFPSHHHVTAMDLDPRQINHFQMLSSGSHQNPLANSLNNHSFSLAMMTHKALHSPNSSKNPSLKDQDFPSSK